MTNNFKPEQVEEWKKQYEEGASLNDLQAIESAKGRSTSDVSIRKAIAAAGGHIRTYSETVNMQLRKRFGRNG